MRNLTLLLGQIAVEVKTESSSPGTLGKVHGWTIFVFPSCFVKMRLEAGVTQ